LSARAAVCLRLLNIRYLYELVEKTPRDLRMQRNFGEKSFREVRDKLAALGLTLGMTLDRPSCATAVTVALVENIRAAKS
jgi:DNA-directed RNA polymerase subunit alpha